MSYLVLSASFELLCYGYTAIINSFSEGIDFNPFLALQLVSLDMKGCICPCGLAFSFNFNIFNFARDPPLKNLNTLNFQIKICCGYFIKSAMRPVIFQSDLFFCRGCQNIKLSLGINKWLIYSSLVAYY